MTEKLDGIVAPPVKVASVSETNDFSKDFSKQYRDLETAIREFREPSLPLNPVDIAVSHGFAHNPRHLSQTNEHFTPIHVVEAARESFGGVIDLDPATTVLANEHRVKAEFIHTQEDDGYFKQWHGCVFLNPPGGRCDENGVSVTSENLVDAEGKPVLDRKGKSKKEWFCVSAACQGSADHSGVSSSQKRWWQKMVAEWVSGRLKQGLFASFSVELFQTTQVDAPAHGLSLLPLDFPFCMPKVRLQYDREIEDIITCKVRYVTGGSPPHASALIYLPDYNGEGEAGIERFVKAYSPIGKVVVPRNIPKVSF